jgi:hypothetical protein
MEKIFITVILLYALFVGIYFLYLKAVKKRKKDIVGKSSSIHETGRLKADIVGKSRFDLSSSKPLTATPPKSENPPGNPDKSALPNEVKSSAEVPLEELDEIFSDKSPEEDILMNIDYPLEYEEEVREGSDEDPEEEESEEVTGAAQATIASGVRFEELGNMVRTVNNPENATLEQKEQAGDTLLEMRQTDMFERLVSGEEKVKLALQLMDDRVNAFYKELDSKKGNAGKKNKPLPADFNTKDFFY